MVGVFGGVWCVWYGVIGDECGGVGVVDFGVYLVVGYGGVGVCCGGGVGVGVGDD